MRFLVKVLAWFFSIAVTLIALGCVAGVVVVYHYSKDLPNYRELESYDPATVTRVYGGDGRLLAEYATEKRIYLPLTAIPKRVQQSFISAEDKNFYKHEGIDYTGILRALRNNFEHNMHPGGEGGRSMAGGSTITQQVVKNFLLTNEKSLERKIREAILAVRISQIYSKDRILELYLNEIYLGSGSYGVAAAGQNYFNKSLDELTVEEAALLAAMPKAPSNYDPRRNYEEAKRRRDYVIERLREDGVLTGEEAREAAATPITLRTRDASEVVHADSFAEEVRRELLQQYGEQGLYEGGMMVKTTLDAKLQALAEQSLQDALIAYDRKRGYRGPVKRGVNAAQLKALEAENKVPLIGNQKLALVTGVETKRANVQFSDGSAGHIPFGWMRWTRKIISDGVLGPEPKKPADVVQVGDVVLAGLPTDEARKALPEAERKGAFELQQVPGVNGAFVALDPHTGRVLALSGGYGGSSFNRATQAKRQPGSAFKPFVYLAALENGYTPSSMVLDAPVELSQGAGLPNWKPQNYHDDYLGPTTLRMGLEKSRNTMTVRLAMALGIDKVIEMSKRLGIYDKPPRNFSIVLGASETTLIRLANAYGMIVNGGKRIAPSLIERIDDRNGKTIFRRDSRQCDACRVQDMEAAAKADTPPIPADNREQVIDPRVAYQMTSMLEGVVLRGTGAAAGKLGLTLAGKTGTTNESRDTWFMGFSPDLVAGIYVGYDAPKTMGKKETGASVALPAFMAFMKTALKDQPVVPFRMPPGIKLTQVDYRSGRPVGGAAPEPSFDSETGEEIYTPRPAPGRVITEAFVTGPPIFIPGRTPLPDFSQPLPEEEPVIKPTPTPKSDEETDEPATAGDDAESPAFPLPPRRRLPGVEQDSPSWRPSRSDSAPVVGTGGLY